MSLAELIMAHGLSPNALAGRAYRCTDPTARLVPLKGISRRLVQLHLEKLESLLEAIVTDTPLPPVGVRHSYRLVDGHHRLALSEALGAAAVPVIRKAT